jgi:hypothetical protein
MQGFMNAGVLAAVSLPCLVAVGVGIVVKACKQRLHDEWPLASSGPVYYACCVRVRTWCGM